MWLVYWSIRPVWFTLNNRQLTYDLADTVQFNLDSLQWIFYCRNNKPSLASSCHYNVEDKWHVDFIERNSFQCRFLLESVGWQTSTFIQWFFSEGVVYYVTWHERTSDIFFFKQSSSQPFFKHIINVLYLFSRPGVIYFTKNLLHMWVILVNQYDMNCLNLDSMLSLVCLVGKFCCQVAYLVKTLYTTRNSGESILPL